MRHVLGISGKDSLVAALILKAQSPLYEELEVFTLLTGADYPETLRWLEAVQSLLGKQLTYLHTDLPGIVERNKKRDEYFLPTRQVRYCTREAKIVPLEKWLGTSPAKLYTGIRDDEARTGYVSRSKKNQIESVFPLVEYGFDLGKVMAVISALAEEYRPPTFFWQEMYDQTRSQWKREFSLLPEMDNYLSPIQKQILFSGRSRPNCYFCFNQRKYEIVWLSRTHPDLFEKMMAYESSNKSWIQDFPLRELTEEKKQEIISRRARKLVKIIASQSFGAISGDGFESMASCGMFCGK